MHSLAVPARLGFVLSLASASFACSGQDATPGPDAATAELCGNGRDDDGNGKIDCADPACLRDPRCQSCGDGVASGIEGCDGADLRGRSCTSLGFTGGTLACLPGCVVDVRGCTVAPPAVEICGNQKDDDGNGKIDCADPACAATAACAVCGDGRVTGDEECDEGATPSACCVSCHAAAGCEVEPNDVAPRQPLVLTADGTGSVRGSIWPAGDVDLFTVTVPPGRTGSLHVVLTRGAGACPPAALEVVDAGGLRVGLAGPAPADACVVVDAVGLPPGAAVVRLRAAATAASTTSFSYALAVALSTAPCGDGVVDPGQECDDGNAVDGDGCSSACRVDARAGHEPDDQYVAASGPFAPPVALLGRIDMPAGATADEDWYELTLPAPANLDLELTVPGDPACAGLVLGTVGLLAATAGGGAPVTATLWGDSATCPHATTLTPSPGPVPSAARVPDPGPAPIPPPTTASALAAGTYYVRVHASGPAGGAYRLLVRYASLCGNGKLETSEDCDGGPSCDSSCHAIPACGNGKLEGSEQCDDGNNTDGDGCSALCTAERSLACGNGVLDPGEQCDTGATPDRCCSDCRIGPGCELEPNDTFEEAVLKPFPLANFHGTLATRPDGLDHDFFAFFLGAGADVVIATTDPTSPGGSCTAPPGVKITLRDADGALFFTGTTDASGCLELRHTLSGRLYSIEVVAAAVHLEPLPYDIEIRFDSQCLDGVLGGTETCDGSCNGETLCVHTQVCGDGITTEPETCDAGSSPSLSCPADCGVTGGTPRCGDGSVNQPSEECDDGNLVAGDGCGPTCRLEPRVACGDGLVNQAGEECDDGNLVAGDGCDGGCHVEPGHHFEVEPNDDGRVAVGESDFSAIHAEGPFTADVTIHGAIFPYGDDDGFAVANPGSAAVTVTAETRGPTAGACTIATQLRLRDAVATLLAFDSDSGLGLCSQLTFTLLPGETRYVQVTDAGDDSLIPAYLLVLSFR